MKKPIKIPWKKIIKFEWFKREYFLYVFGFMLNFRPTEPFVDDFYTNPDHLRVDLETVNLKISPIYVYSTAAQLPFVFLLSDFLSYTPFIMISSLAGIIASGFTLWDNSFCGLQLAQAFYGTVSAAEISYYVSVYANAEKKDYQKLTSFVRAAPLFAKMISALIGQPFISLEVLTYRQLHYFNLAGFIIATIVTILLPPVDENVYHDEELGKERKTICQKISMLGSNFIKSFPDKYSVKLSIWSALAICGFSQVVLYIQPVWKLNSPHKTNNGVIYGMLDFACFLSTLLGGVFVFDWKYKGDLILTFISILQGFTLILISQLQGEFYNRLFYIMFCCLFYFTITTVFAEIVKKLDKGCFGLAIGFLYVIGIALSAAVTYLLREVLMKLDDYKRDFMIYGYFHLALGVLYIFIGLSYWLAKHTYG